LFCSERIDHDNQKQTSQMTLNRAIAKDGGQNQWKTEHGHRFSLTGILLIQN
jgi:hypothetical protein